MNTNSLFFLCSLLFISSKIFAQSSLPVTGTEYGGGILIYKDEIQNKGIVLAEQDLGDKMTWEESKLECLKYAAGGFKDWQLPQINDFEYIYSFLDSKYHWDENKGMRPGYYWSLTEYDTEYMSYAFSFQEKDYNRGKQDARLRVRPVRYVTFK